MRWPPGSGQPESRQRLLVTWDKAPEKAPVERLVLALDPALAALADVRLSLAEGAEQAAG
jgi:hypothetical protein